MRKCRIDRAFMVVCVANQIPSASADDLPLIRQVINDTADSYRKDGWLVSDFAQDKIVRAIQQRIKERETALRMRSDRLRA